MEELLMIAEALVIDESNVMEVQVSFTPSFQLFGHEAKIIFLGSRTMTVIWWSEVLAELCF
jgi:hypothetical protein